MRPKATEYLRTAIITGREMLKQSILDKLRASFPGRP
jgi:hypothetical protein